MKRIILSAATLLALALPGHALLLSFDEGSTTTGTGRPLTVSFTVDNAYLETVDAFGEPLAVPVWTPIDPAGIGNPADAGYGAPISGSGALNAEFDQILFTFDSPVFLREFSTVLDDSGRGNLAPSSILFFNAADILLGELVIDQTQLGMRARFDAVPLAGVKKIVMPAGAYYDDVTLNVPETGPGLVVLGGACLLGVLIRQGGSGSGRGGHRQRSSASV